jgi:hypothetical protein
VRIRHYFKAFFLTGVRSTGIVHITKAVKVYASGNEYRQKNSSCRKEKLSDTKAVAD